MVLSPEPPLEGWLKDLDGWLERSPGFFFGRPVVLDVGALQPGKAGLSELLEKLTQRNIKVMGVEGAEPSWLDFAMPPLLLSGRQAGANSGENPPGAGEAAAPAPFSDCNPEPAVYGAASALAAAQPQPQAAPTQLPNSLLHDQSVRSGQSIVHPEGDVVIIGSVASGAEVIAGGSIHIYGPLRGRAIAGSRNARARIFCRKLEAELLSIDGLYMVADDMPGHLRGKQVQVWLDGDSMIMAQD